jgi:hypothetical protein
MRALVGRAPRQARSPQAVVPQEEARMPTRIACALAVFVALAAIVPLRAMATTPAIANWPAPPFWSGAPQSVSPGSSSPESADAIAVAITPPLPFIGLTPCRIADTRGNGFAGAYGPPALSQGIPRNFVLTGQCDIPVGAGAVSLNVTATNTQGPGFLMIFPEGAAQPLVSTLNYVGGQTVANAAVVPLGSNGAITVVAGVSDTDMVLDVNGYYGGSVVTQLNGLSGAVALAPGANVSITPSGQTLTIAASAGPGGVLPTGTAGQTLRHNGTSWVASSALTNDGSNVAVSGVLGLPSTVKVTAGADRFLHNEGGANNVFLGLRAGNDFAAPSGDANTGVGFQALSSVTSGGGNVAVGQGALNSMKTGFGNIALGSTAMEDGVSGSNNIAIGSDAGINIDGGNSNIIIGNQAGGNISTGSNNIYIANAGFNNESGQIRIGDNAHQSGTVIAGIAGATSVGGVPVLINSGGRMGTTTSSGRFKEDIRDMGSMSDGLMRLRPVAFRYKPEIDPTGLLQYGLVAEEVAEVYPELVASDEEGRPQAIRYQFLAPLLLNELQKQRRTIDDQAATIRQQQGAIEELRTRLAAIEGRVEAPQP